MRTLLILGFALATLAMPAQARLDVVATTPDLAAIVREVGGAEVKVTSLARPTEDPHFVDPKPSFLVRLNRADLLVEGGAELESGWLRPLVDQARNARLMKGARGRVAASEGIRFLEVPETLDRSEGDIHAMGNPHYLVDPENAKIVARNIAAKLCELDPKNCAKYELNQKDFTRRLDSKIAEWQRLLEPYKGSRIAAYHNSWPYFGHRFGLKIDLFLEPKPGIPPSPAALAGAISEMKKDNVKAIICDPYLNHKTAEKVASETGAEVVETSHFPGALQGVKDDYIPLIDHLVRSLAEALGKR